MYSLTSSGIALIVSHSVSHLKRQVLLGKFVDVAKTFITHGQRILQEAGTVEA